MQHPDRRELLRRAGEAYREHGHGVLLLMEGRKSLFTLSARS